MMFRFSALFAATAIAAMPAAASTLFTAELQTPVEETTRIAAYDAIWICEADTCEAVLNRRTATVRVCKRVVEELGPINAFGTTSDPLTEDEITECNASLN